MEAESGIKIITISNLLDLSSPLSGASSLPSSTSASSSSSPPPPPPLKKLKSLPNPSPNPISFSPNHPVLLIGTVDLQTPEDCDGTSCRGHCFSFSDASSRVCCSIVDPKDLSFVGRKIHVLAWNFLPFKHEKGVLEIARWMLPPSVRMSADPNPEPSFSAPMRSHRFICVGALKSVSPIFSVPCKNRVFDGESTGFLAEIFTCSCDRCRNFDIRKPALDPSEHSFVNPNFVYFLKPACKWRPVMNLLVGKLIVISGLRKKKIVVRKDVTHEMFLSTERTVVSLCQLPLAIPSILKDEEVYNGVVTGVYMKGMAVELDSKVWLVVTEKQIPPPHSVRVGAIISVKNFHHLHPKFSWIEMHLLGTFARTSIDVKSFSMAHTRSYVRAEGQRMLGRFIESLTPSTKFWMLLLISCFRRKFAKLFSDEEILGSKNQEGLAQVYARRYLDPHFFQSQHGIFMEFFKHGEYTCEKESSMSSLKLVTPISNLISKCEALWASKISKAPCNAETFHRDGCGNYSTSKVASCCCTIRRVLSSKDLGCILMGTLKVSPLGSLQLVDATGSIDAVIPDLLSDISYQSIYEVKNYKLIMEGSPVQADCMGLHSVEAFSCKHIFDQFPSKKVLDHLKVYVVFYLRDSSCLNVHFQIPTFNLGNDVISITGGTTQLLLVTHKFPAIKNVDPIEGHPLSFNNILFAEVIVLPYKLILQEDNDYSISANTLCGKLLEESIYVQQDGLKKPNSLGIHSRIMADDSINGSEEVKKRLKIPCLLTLGSTDGQLCPVPGYLCRTGNTARGNIIDRQQEQRLLLEFKADSLFKYQFLQLGGYYILKCSNRRERDTSINSKTNNGKIYVTQQMTFWSLSFSFGERMGPSQNQSSRSSLFGASEAYEGDVSPGNIILQQSFSQMHKTSDVHVHFFSEERDIFRIIPEPVEVLSVSSCLHILKAKIGRTSSVADTQCRDMPQGNLISLCGNIEIIQIYNYKSRPYMSSNQLDCMDIDQRMCGNIVIHLCNDHHKVLIHGNFRKHMYPVGLGPGANATFHRVLVTCPSSGCPTLVLTPVSFVVINFIKEVGHQHSKERTRPQAETSFAVEESSSIVLGLMSQLTRCLENKLIQCSCRVLTVYALVLERPIHVPSKSQSNYHLKLPALNVALAGFVMDDGSSLSCWWANSLATMRLLRFHGTVHRPLLHYSKTSMRCKAKNSQDTVGYHLEKMLKTYDRIIVKSDRVSHYSSTPSFTFHVDSGVLSCPDERKLWLIMLDACASSVSNIVGRVMDSNSLQLLDTELKELNMTMPSMPSVWITEVGCLNPLHEARNLLHELIS